MPEHLPKLRPIEVYPFVQDGRPMLLLRDPLSLSGQIAALPQVLGPALALCDGRHTPRGIQTALVLQHRLQVSLDVVEQIVATLDELCLLDNERAAAVQAQALAEYRRAPHRPPALAGSSYPADPGELHERLEGYRAAARQQYADVIRPRPGLCGLVSPHIDYGRGGPVYAAVWEQAAAAACAADLAIIFGTDHYGGHGALTLTRQQYATPYGVLPTNHAIVDAAAAAIGEEAAFEEELHHRSEHSIELAAIWLHHMRGGIACEVTPVLCGSFGHFVAGAADPERDARITALVTALKQATAGRRILVVAAADLAHIGPAFGGVEVDAAGRDALRAADAGLLAQVHEGDATGFFQALQQVQDRNNVCGLPPIYLALRLLGSVAGETIAYDQCPADDHETSWVSVAGVVWGESHLCHPMTPVL